MKLLDFEVPRVSFRETLYRIVFPFGRDALNELLPVPLIVRGDKEVSSCQDSNADPGQHTGNMFVTGLAAMGTQHTGPMHEMTYRGTR